MKITDSTILVTGANRGLGKALVDQALRSGAKRIYAGARQPFAHADRRVTPLLLDVTNAAQIRMAAEEVEAHDARSRPSEGLSRVRRGSDLRRGGKRARGNLPRSNVGGNRGGLAQQCCQGAPAPVCWLRRTNSGQVKSSAAIDSRLALG